jgi:hypothetical protein
MASAVAGAVLEDIFWKTVAQCQEVEQDDEKLSKSIVRACHVLYPQNVHLFHRYHCFE